MLMNNESLRMRFEGDDEIDLETLSISLNATVNCLKKISDSVLPKDSFCKFVVSNVQPGSFIIDIKTIITEAPKLVHLGASVVTIFSGIMGVRKFLKGRPPKNIVKLPEENKVSVVNNNGDEIKIDNIIINIYINDNDIENELSKMNKALIKDTARTSLILEANDQDGELIERTEYSEDDLVLTKDALDIESLNTNNFENSITTDVQVKKAIFQGDSKWEFIHLFGDCRTISATVSDKEFLQNVHNGTILLSSKHILNVELRSRARMGEAGCGIGKISYYIDKVNKVKEPDNTATQTELKL